jgi:hypothetical protein
MSQNSGFGARDMRQAELFRELPSKPTGWQNHTRVRCTETVRLQALTEFQTRRRKSVSTNSHQAVRSLIQFRLNPAPVLTASAASVERQG